MMVLLHSLVWIALAESGWRYELTQFPRFLMVLACWREDVACPQERRGGFMRSAMDDTDSEQRDWGISLTWAGLAFETTAPGSPETAK